MNGHSEFKYIIHVDGYSVAGRLLTTMLTGSLILRVKSKFYLWCDEFIKPDVHYIVIKEDLSDLIEKIKWCKKNDNYCKKIAKNGFKYAKKVLTIDFILDYMNDLFWKLV